MSDDNDKVDTSGHTRLGRIVEKLDSGGVTLRAAVEEIEAVFSTAPEAMKERAKLERFIGLLTQQHLKGLAQAVKLLVIGVTTQKADEATEALKVYIANLQMSYGMLAEERLRLLGQDKKLVVAQESDIPETPDDRS